ncbi:hypothetical protein BLM37_02155 [Candidatus Gracilibacteria bacterium GN02-873]|nr:hypothetical protein BLM37_02155 [Candidatus Gracilibacteria bacterium GN02-873]
MKILVVEDNLKIRENIIDFFKIQGHLAEGAENGYEALTMLHAMYDIVILDINMPKMNGKEFLEKMRTTEKNLPVIALTSNSTIENKAEIFELGVDDYLTKPFDMRELEMRVLALYRRKGTTIETEIRFADCILYPEKHTLIQNGENVILTSKEYLILEFLARHKGFPKTKLEILEAAWGLREAELNFNSITLEVHISGLRKKLGKNIIETVKGTGYLIA